MSSFGGGCSSASLLSGIIAWRDGWWLMCSVFEERVSEMCDLRDVSVRKLMYEWVVVAVGGGISVVLGHVGVSTSVFVTMVDCVCGFGD